MKRFSSIYSRSEKVQEIVKNIKDYKEPVYIKGLSGSSLSLISSVVCELTEDFTHIFLFEDKQKAAYFYNDLERYYNDSEIDYNEKHVLFYPSSFFHENDTNKLNNANILLRTAILERLSLSTAKIIVTYPQAFCEKTVDKKSFNKKTFTIAKNEELNIDQLIDVLDDFGFERSDLVYQAGQYSIRGGIIDVFSFSQENPYRIELFGDTIDSLRTFDVLTQLSIEEKESFNILPNFTLSQEQTTKTSFTKWLNDKTILWVNQADLCLAKTMQIEEKQNSNDTFIKSKELLNYIKEKKIFFLGKNFQSKEKNPLIFDIISQPVFNANFPMLIDCLEQKQEQNYQTCFCVLDAQQKERVEKVLVEFAKNRNITTPVFLQGSIAEGFIDNDHKLLLFTDHQLFNRYHKYKLRDGSKEQEKITMESLLSLTPGDYVTHIDHGIGVFAGLAKIDKGGKKQEAIRLIFKGNDTLYVSIHSLHKISRYSSKDTANIPKLNRLGSTTWQTLKNKTKQKVKDIAKDLIALYAERKATKGYAFSADSYLQNSLEASFMYEDTPDQLKATIDVKRDMESSHPMDRLVCGDVGFGKTEVAIRAAFKAVCDSKQVVVLVPTTILAFQHWKTFSRRLKDFPCRVDYLNRFRTTKEKNQILKDLQSGKIDILIGTHRVVGKDVKFKDLGLLIIDEEHKFGVSVKEKLKQLKVNIDTLTLSATPIPRTLQFSLMGARDLSIINTPPANRQPVNTQVINFDKELIRDAIDFEIQRGGQVYFVHNRVQTIHEIAQTLHQLVPKARIIVGHGQMEGEALERVMLDFIEGQYDILVSTTIVENGLDIPNANTIMINDAQNYGLSDLHQLRGRVGRSNAKAFCYLIAPESYLLTPEAHKRLSAIEEFSAIGSGFAIAMRDLDIRGAGNLLGAEQSGFISDIGFETYHKILNEAMDEIRQDCGQIQEDATKRECVIETDLEILIPDNYITNVVERLKIYKQLDSMEDDKDLAPLIQSLTDRFGTIPWQTLELFQIVKLRMLAKKIYAEKISIKQNKMAITFNFQSNAVERILSYVQSYPSQSKVVEQEDKVILNITSIDNLEKAIKVFSYLQEDFVEKL
ncbi:MAG: transcription-repair coupling factor [Bacteroidales bacterium]|nr:transcription-repair coupling factor [Bacteroidales bacterium]